MTLHVCLSVPIYLFVYFLHNIFFTLYITLFDVEFPCVFQMLVLQNEGQACQTTPRGGAIRQDTLLPWKCSGFASTILFPHKST